MEFFQSLILGIMIIFIIQHNLKDNKYSYIIAYKDSDNDFRLRFAFIIAVFSLVHIILSVGYRNDIEKYRSIEFYSFIIVLCILYLILNYLIQNIQITRNKIKELKDKQ